MKNKNTDSTPITLNSDSPISGGKLSAEALAALSTFGLGPQATINALAALDAEKALADGATKKVLREFRALAQSVGIDLANASTLARKPRESKADNGDAIELPNEVRIVMLLLEGDNTVVTIEGTNDGRRFEFAIPASSEASAGLRLGSTGRFAFITDRDGERRL